MPAAAGSVAAEPPLAVARTLLPLAQVNAYSNQQLIDAFFDAANALHHGDYQKLLARAALDLQQLAADRAARYAGPALAQLPNLTDAECEEIHQSLVRQLQRRATSGKVNTRDGLNVRVGPSRDHAILHTLPIGTPVTILGEVDGGERNTWLLIASGACVGWAFAEFVTRTEGSSASLLTLTYSGSLAPTMRLTPSADASSHVVGAANTWNEYGALIQAECQRLNIDPAVAVAILGVESSGRAFEGERMVIRFENHLFLHYWGQHHRAQFDCHFTGSSNGSEHRWRPDPNGEWQPCHTNQATEWQVFDLARTLDEQAAMYSISMGAAQIMGFNHAAVGYGTVQAMFEAFQSDVRHQLAALFRFIEVNRLQDAVRVPDFVAFARRYNGHGQEAIYAPRMQLYYDAFRQLMAAQVPPTTRPTGSTAGGSSKQAAPASRLPQPSTVAPLAVDPDLLALWRKHVADSIATHQTLLDKVRQGVLRPYWTTVWMYRILFALGVLAFGVAASVAFSSGRALTTLLFGTLSATAILGYFFNRPAVALAQNLQHLTWLGIVYNTYWTRLTLLRDERTIHRDIHRDIHYDINTVTDEAIGHIQSLVAAQAQQSTARPGLHWPGRREQ